jgi:hypothetical protein
LNLNFEEGETWACCEECLSSDADKALLFTSLFLDLKEGDG